MDRVRVRARVRVIVRVRARVRLGFEFQQAVAFEILDSMVLQELLWSI